MRKGGGNKTAGPKATANALRKDAEAVRRIALAEKRRAETLTAVAQAYRAEADDPDAKWAVDALRQHAAITEQLATVLEAEAATHERAAIRIDLDAERAEGRALPTRGAAHPTVLKRSRGKRRSGR